MEFYYLAIFLIGVYILIKFYKKHKRRRAIKQIRKEINCKCDETEVLFTSFKNDSMRKNYIFIALSLLFMMSCSPTKRLERIIERSPELFEQVEVEVHLIDTINYIDTIEVKGSGATKTFKRNKGTNFIEFDTKDFLTTIEFEPLNGLFSDNQVKQIRESVKVRTVVKDRIVIKEKKIYIDKIIKTKATVPKPIIKTVTPKWAWFLLVLFGLVAFVVIFDRLAKFYRKDQRAANTKRKPIEITKILTGWKWFK